MIKDDAAPRRPHTPDGPNLPTLEALQKAWAQLQPAIRKTPVQPWSDPRLTPLAPVGATLSLKLELFQVTGTFKARGALSVVRSLSRDQMRRGVTAVSAGNHAVAVSFASSVVGTDAVVVMPKSANPARVDLCRMYGATVRLMDDVRAAFDEVARLEAEEGRAFVHPFDSEPTILGTGTLGLEWIDQVPDLDAVVVPIGGGGLMAGVSAAVKQIRPDCVVYGVEPEGADVMRRSFETGAPVQAGEGTTIADSLAPPFTLPYSFGICHQCVDRIVTVSDDDLCKSLYLLFQSAKLAVEPAGAAATAGVLGPLRDELAGQKIGVLVCGANIDPTTYLTYLRRGEDLASRGIEP